MYVSKNSRNFALVIQLQRHIEILLLENDCVIVPNFGGFITHHVPARYDAEDRAFLPPLRTLGFNPQLRMNDSVLVQSYVEAYDISYPEALRRVEQEVCELKSQLDSEGHYTLEDLGELTVNQEGNYEFAPCEAGILSPEFYGLDSYTFKRLKDAEFAEAGVLPETIIVEQTEATTIELPEQSVEQPSLLEFTCSDDDDKAISIKMSWVRNAVAVAAAVVAFFLFATPIANGDLGTQTMSQLQHSILYKLIPQDTNIVPAAKPIATKKVETPVNTNENKTPQASVNIKKPATPTYLIVVASQVKLSNAEQYVAKLKQEGYKDAKVYIHNQTVRVICGEFQTESEAYRQLNKMSQKDEFAEAWVYKQKAEV